MLNNELDIQDFSSYVNGVLSTKKDKPMKQAVTFSDFTNAFRAHGREDQFSYDALRVLFDWFERLDDDCDTETELDVIAICCEFSEQPWKDIASDYSVDLGDCDDDDERRAAVIDHLEYNTSVCGETNEAIVYQQF